MIKARQYNSEKRRSIKRFKHGVTFMVKAATIALIFTFFIIACSCSRVTGPSDNIKDTGSNPPSEVIGNSGSDGMGSDSEPVQDEEGDKTYSITNPETDMVFDFAEFPENDFPRGQTTINQLIIKYGVPDEVYADYLPIYSAGYAFLVFRNKDFEISSVWISVEELSFGKELLAGSEGELHKEKKYYDLTGADKNFKFEIQSIKFFSNTIKYPREIEIGISTKQDVLDAYPQGTAYAYKSWGDQITNEISFNYNFPDKSDGLSDQFIGSVVYSFDESDMLVSIAVNWQQGGD